MSFGKVKSTISAGNIALPLSSAAFPKLWTIWVLKAPGVIVSAGPGLLGATVSIAVVILAVV